VQASQIVGFTKRFHPEKQASFPPEQASPESRGAAIMSKASDV
jgi:hypothetical protein